MNWSFNAYKLLLFILTFETEGEAWLDGKITDKKIIT